MVVDAVIYVVVGKASMRMVTSIVYKYGAAESGGSGV